MVLVNAIQMDVLNTQFILKKIDSVDVSMHFDFYQTQGALICLTLATPRGIGVTLNPKKGGQNDPTKIIFMIVFKLLLIFFY